MSDTLIVGKPMTKTKKQVEIDFNPEFKRALELMEEIDKNIFITGRAGTGKSTLLNYFLNALP